MCTAHAHALVLVCVCRLLVQLLEARRSATGLAVPIGQLLRVLRVLRGAGDAASRQMDRCHRVLIASSVLVMLAFRASGRQ